MDHVLKGLLLIRSILMTMLPIDDEEITGDPVLEQIDANFARIEKLFSKEYPSNSTKVVKHVIENTSGRTLVDFITNIPGTYIQPRYSFVDAITKANIVQWDPVDLAGVLLGKWEVCTDGQFNKRLKKNEPDIKPIIFKSRACESTITRFVNKLPNKGTGMSFDAITLRASVRRSARSSPVKPLLTYVREDEDVPGVNLMSDFLDRMENLVAVVSKQTRTSNRVFSDFGKVLSYHYIEQFVRIVVRMLELSHGNASLAQKIFACAKDVDTQVVQMAHQLKKHFADGSNPPELYLDPDQVRKAFAGMNDYCLCITDTYAYLERLLSSIGMQ